MVEAVTMPSLMMTSIVSEESHGGHACTHTHTLGSSKLKLSEDHYQKICTRSREQIYRKVGSKFCVNEATVYALPAHTD